MYASVESRLEAPNQAEYWNNLELAYDEEMTALETKNFIPYTLVDLREKLGKNPRASKLTKGSWFGFGTAEGQAILKKVNAFLDDKKANRNPTREALEQTMMGLLEFAINTKDIFDQWLTDYFNEEAFRFYTFGNPVLQNDEFDVVGYLASLDLASYGSTVVNRNLMLIKHYCKNGDKFRSIKGSTSLYRAPGVVNRYIFEDRNVVEIDREIALYSSFLEGSFENKSYFLDGEQVSAEVFAAVFEEEYEKQSYYLLMNKNGQNEKKLEYRIHKLRFDLSKSVSPYPNTIPIKNEAELQELKDEM